ncbi:MAG TPA: holo-ACP synthase [Tepidisphaeraceae bacterium]|jgi:holo-[acyl-carrier protein] synthase
MLLGHGIDIVQVDRIGELVQRHGDHFLNRVFTPGELQYCGKNPKRYVEHLAGRFAAKEAILKALGTGWTGGIAWTDMEILPDGAGRPMLKLIGQCAEIATEKKIARWHISISHVSTHATASAIAEGDST